MRAVDNRFGYGAMQLRVDFLPATDRATQLCYSRRLVMFRRRAVMLVRANAS